MFKRGETLRSIKIALTRIRNLPKKYIYKDNTTFRTSVREDPKR